MFHVTADDRFPYWVYGGQQESGSAGVASRGNDGQITVRDWHPVGVEEYGYAAPDPLHPGVVYGGKVTRFEETTGMTQEVGPVVLRTGKYRFVRTAPILFSPVDPHVLYFALNVLFQTRDGGQNWEIISPDLTREDPGVPETLAAYAAKAKGNRRGVIYALGPSPRDIRTIWAGTDDGLVQVTRDGGKTWSNVTPPEMTPWSKVTQIDASHFDAETAYVSVSRFRLDDLSPYIYRTHDGGKTWRKIVAGLPDNASVNVVREDPERHGLLFAGTERAVWVSFDDGERWQPLQLNLPGDLDARPDRQGRRPRRRDARTLLLDPGRRHAAAAGDTGSGGAEAFLFRPQVTHRIRRNQNTDTPPPPEEPAGENPPDGAILDYWLKAAPTGPGDPRDPGRRGSASCAASRAPIPRRPIDPNAYPAASYWMRPPQALSAAAGMHRFVWDLHGPPPDVLSRELPISAVRGRTPLHPQGPLALPGTYTVRLTASGRTLTQPLTIVMDPRVPTPPEGLRAQADLARRICEELAKDFRTLAQVRALRARIAAAGDGVKGSPLAQDLQALDAEAAGLENAAAAPGSLEGEGLARLNARFATLLDVVEGADAAPTAQALAAFGDAQKALAERLVAVEALKERDVAAVNAEVAAGESARSVDRARLRRRRA